MNAIQFFDLVPRKSRSQDPGFRIKQETSSFAGDGSKDPFANANGSHETSSAVPRSNAVLTEPIGCRSCRADGVALIATDSFGKLQQAP